MSVMEPPRLLSPTKPNPEDQIAREAVGSPRRRPRRQRNRALRKFFLIVVVGLLLPSVVAVVVTWRLLQEVSVDARTGRDELQAGAHLLKASNGTFSNAQISAAQADFDGAKRHFAHVHSVLMTNPSLRILASAPWFHDQVSGARDLADIGIHLSNTGQVVTAVAGKLLAEEPPGTTHTKDPGRRALEALTVVGPQLGQISSDLDQVATDRKRIPKFGLLPELTRAATQLDSSFDLAAAQREIAVLRSDRPGIMALLGASGPVSYLVLEQDPAEIRATGGFIGSVGFLSFNVGTMAPFEPQDVYQIDFHSIAGQRTDPPEPLKKTFGLDNWQLRDSNWSPDYPTAARQAELFLTKESGRQVNGTIAFDPYFIAKLLSITGPTQVPETGDIVTADNFFQLTLTRVEVKNASSAARKTFLAQAAKAILSRVLTLPPGKLFSLIGVLQSGCENRSLQAYFHDIEVQALVQRHRCDGGLRAPKGDSLMIVDSNVGGNKDDFWLKRQFDLRVSLLPDGSVVHTLKLHYDGISPHDGVTGTWGYTGWLRIYLPAKATLVSASGMAVTVTNDLGHTVLEGWLYVPFYRTTDVTITYTLAAADIHSSQGHLDLVWQKQAGRVADPISVELSLPEGWKLKSEKLGSSKLNDPKIGSDLSIDREFAFDFQSP